MTDAGSQMRTPFKFRNTDFILSELAHQGVSYEEALTTAANHNEFKTATLSQQLNDNQCQTVLNLSYERIVTDDTIEDDLTITNEAESFSRVLINLLKLTGVDGTYTLCCNTGSDVFYGRISGCGFTDVHYSEPSEPEFEGITELSIPLRDELDTTLGLFLIRDKFQDYNADLIYEL